MTQAQCSKETKHQHVQLCCLSEKPDTQVTWEQPSTHKSRTETDPHTEAPYPERDRTGRRIRVTLTEWGLRVAKPNTQIHGVGQSSFSHREEHKHTVLVLCTGAPHVWH